MSSQKWLLYREVTLIQTQGKFNKICFCNEMKWTEFLPSIYGQQNPISACAVQAGHLLPLIESLEPQRQKTYLWTCAPSEDSDQTAHSRSLIRIFTGRILDSQGCKVSSCGQRRLVRLRGAQNYDFHESSSGAHVRSYVFSRRGSLDTVECWGPPRGYGEQGNNVIFSGEQGNTSLKMTGTGEQV